VSLSRPGSRGGAGGAPQKSAGLPQATPGQFVFLSLSETYLNSPWAVINMVLRHSAANGIEPLVVLGDYTQGLLDFGGVRYSVLRMPFGGRGRA